MTPLPNRRPEPSNSLVVAACPGCGVSAAAAGGGAPPVEHHASAGCYALYCQVLARDYANPEYYRLAHQVVVDDYAAQHAGGTSRREIQTVALCLMTLCLFVEGGVAPADGPALHKRMVAQRPLSRRRDPRDSSVPRHLPVQTSTLICGEQCLKPVDRPAEAADRLGGVVPSR